jgi:hypothetical protein
MTAGFRRLRYAAAPANIHRASGAEEFASKIFQRAGVDCSQLWSPEPSDSHPLIVMDFYLRPPYTLGRLIYHQIPISIPARIS